VPCDGGERTGIGVDNVLPFMIFGVIVALAAVCIIASAIGDRRRRAALAEVAEQLGLSYVEDGSSLLAELSGLPLFSRGRSKHISSLIHGDTDEVAMGIFDYRYTVGSGKNAHTYRQTVICFRSPDLDLPQFELKPQSFLHGIGKLFGYQDIDFESHPKFSKTVVLRGTQETAVRKLFTDPLLSFLETKPQIHIEGQGRNLIFYRSSKRVRPDQFKELMREGFEVYTQFAAAGK
jgi:hypothetical protein